MCQISTLTTPGERAQKVSVFPALLLMKRWHCDWLSINLCNENLVLNLRPGDMRNP